MCYNNWQDVPLLFQPALCMFSHRARLNIGAQLPGWNMNRLFNLKLLLLNTKRQVHFLEKIILFDKPAQDVSNCLSQWHVQKRAHPFVMSRLIDPFFFLNVYNNWTIKHGLKQIQWAQHNCALGSKKIKRQNLMNNPRNKCAQLAYKVVLVSKTK